MDAADLITVSAELGTDILRLDGAGVAFDFAGMGDNTLSLSAVDLLVFANGLATLVVDQDIDHMGILF